MDFANLHFGFETVRWIVVTAIGIYAWIVGRQSASNKEMLDLRTRITRLEVDIKQVPDHKQLHELALQLGRTAAGLESLSTRIEAMDKSVTRVEDYLLHNK
ncbi:DUF2730 domain-containing protein [Allofranklinella schreckenbergeri]|uniref:DUF2730 domain-containing protein n=1 Tax=Allofranklinella schreckenbergeri TaxID=1076744 RepID=A0A3M6QY17_9BURK|nr:DUF2730 domain-containing protein [Allofranklinella schreckenbergeri]RMX07432.1 DUF2730 domain-containing protein [Allofranklinella schreckenbergeri]